MSGRVLEKRKHTNTYPSNGQTKNDYRQYIVQWKIIPNVEMVKSADGVISVLAA